MLTRPNPTPENPGQSRPAASPAVRRVTILAICLTTFSYPVDRWLGVVDHAADTYTKLKDSGLLDALVGW